VRNGGKLVSIPYDFELNDANPKPMTVEALARYWKWQFDRLWREGEQSGRVMSIPVHPYLIGQPQAAGYFRDVFDHIRRHDGVWYTTADEIAEHFIAHSYDAQLAFAQKLAAETGAP
jgi:hypothetical protein